MSTDQHAQERHDNRIVVVGAGPVGATLALELARHGVPSTVLDRAPQASRHPKMDFVNARSMELLHRLGLADAMRDIGVPTDHTSTFLWTRRFDEAPIIEWTYPSADEMRRRMARINDGSMPREPYQRVPGSYFEELGRARCRAEGLVDLREGWSFEGLTQDADGVTAEVVETTTGRRERLRARYLVACDGAGSTVKQHVGIPTDETGPRAENFDVYFRSTDPALRRHGPFFVCVCAPGLSLVSRDGSTTWTGTFPLMGEEPPADPLAVVRERLGLDFEVDEVLTTARWEGRLAVARRYREGSVFLAGDAAHQFFPTGGLGANTGFGDAVDLGWKLAAVVNGWGGPRLLDAYEAERRPVALFNREMSFNVLEVWRRFPTLYAGGATPAQLAGFLDHERHQVDNLGIHAGYRYGTSPVVCHEEGPEPPWEWQRIVPTTWPGGRLPSMRRADGAELYDLLGPELTLVDTSGSRAGKPLADAAAKRGVPLRLLTVDDPDVRAVLERDLVLVRPDHHVAWRGDAVPRDAAAVLDRVRGH